MAEHKLVLLPIGKVLQSPDNPRQDVGDIAGLAESIKSVGILQPLVAVAVNGHFELIAGARRLSAAALAGLKEVPVIVREDLDDKGLREARLIENLQREDIAPMEEAQAFQALLEMGRSQRDLATRIGVSQSHISKRLSLLKLSSYVQEQVTKGKIEVTDALELAKLKDPEQQDDALKMAAQTHAPVTKAVEAVSKQAESAEKIEAIRSKYERWGVAIVESKEDAPDAKMIGKESWDAPEWLKSLDVKKHRKEDCAAVIIRAPRWGGGNPEVIEVCTNPNGHKPKTPTGLADEDLTPEQLADRVARRDRNALYKALREADTERRAFALKLAGKAGTRQGPKAEEILELSFVRSTTYPMSRDFSFVAEWIGWTDEEDQGSYYRSQQVRDHEFPSFAVAVAVVEFGMVEDYLHKDPAHATYSDHREYMELLERHGYTLSEAEKTKLADKDEVEDIDDVEDFKAAVAEAE